MTGAVSDVFIGAGWAFPIGTSATGGIALASGEARITQSIWLTLQTTPGERVMRPEFGCDLRQYVFMPADATTGGLIRREVERALRRWEPRIDLAAVDVVPDGDDRSVLLISVSYTVRATNDPRNLVFPFYVIPDEPDSRPARQAG